MVGSEGRNRGGRGPEVVGTRDSGVKGWESWGLRVVGVKGVLGTGKGSKVVGV